MRYATSHIFSFQSPLRTGHFPVATGHGRDVIHVRPRLHFTHPAKHTCQISARQVPFAGGSDKNMSMGVTR